MSHLRHSFALSGAFPTIITCPLNRHSNTLPMYISSFKAADMQAVADYACFDDTPMRSRLAVKPSSINL
jgi:hypothetical protein